MDGVEELYQELLLDHFKNPRCHEPVPEPSVTHLALNPLCGDRVALSIKSHEGKLVQIGLQGKGCCISQAAASMLSELCQGKSIEEAQTILDDFRAMMRGEKEADQVPGLDEARALVGVRKFTARMKCALLGCDALDHCLKECCSGGSCQGKEGCPSPCADAKH